MSEGGDSIPNHSAPAGLAELPGDSGVWLFILADVCSFGVFFLLFTIGRAGNPVEFDESRLALDPRLGLLNTLILLTSSLFMVHAVHAARASDRRAVIANLRRALGVGSLFGFTKIFEYAAEIGVGNTMLTNDFFMYYYVLTGIHFLHFAVGVAVLSLCLVKARSEALDARFRVWIEATGCYWHMVDLLWIFLFPMLYLQGSS